MWTETEAFTGCCVLISEDEATLRYAGISNSISKCLLYKSTFSAHDVMPVIFIFFLSHQVYEDCALNGASSWVSDDVWSHFRAFIDIMEDSFSSVV